MPKRPPARTSSRPVSPRSAPSRPSRRPPGGSGGGTAPRPRDVAPRATDAGKLLRVAGLPAVAALFERSPERVERLFFEARMQPHAAPFCRVLAASRRPYRLIESDELERVAGTALHGGIVAVARPRPILAFDAETAVRWAAAEGKPLLLLDGIGNPHNLGAIARTAAFFGLPRIVISDDPAQAAPSDAAHRVAEGGLDRIELYRATGLPAALKRLRASYRVLGTALGRGRPLDAIERDLTTRGDRDITASRRRPVALVLGNEEDGLGAASLAACEEIVTIPGAGGVQSLNVSAAAAILIHAFARLGGTH
jgi:TrmH RNA methyltransferase